MGMAPGDEAATAQALTRDFNERYRDLGPRVLAFCLSTYQHGNMVKADRPNQKPSPDPHAQPPSA
jgi:hypothetical protein